MPLCTWQATSVQSCYVVDTLDPSQEESDEVSEFSDRDIEALDGAILEDEEQDEVRMKALSALVKVSKEKRRLERRAAGLDAARSCSGFAIPSERPCRQRTRPP